MPVTNATNPGTLVNDNGYGAVAWTNLGGAAYNDGFFATASLNTSQSSNYLTATNFGFNVPATATILGVLAQVGRMSAHQNITDDRVYLVKAGAYQTGWNRASVAQWPTTDTAQSYGGLGDLWGQNLTPADINSSGFGITIAAKNNGGAADTASVDYIQITVYYQLLGDLIPLTRALQNFNFSPAVSQYPLVGTLITACSTAIKKYCKRDFYSRLYDELYNGNGDRRLLLREYPIQAVQSVRYRPVTVLKIINNNVAQNQQARVQVTSTGVQCWRMASGVPTLETLLTYATFPTLQTMASAVTALGNGWSGQVVGDSGAFGGQGDYGLWPSADLYVPPSYGDGLTSQGNLTARGCFAELKMHTYELQGYQFDPRGWLLRAIPYTDPELLHPEDLIWPVGINNFRVQYVAGYTTIPEAVQEACAEWTQILWNKTQRDALIQSQTIPGALTANYGTLDPGKPPMTVCQLLAPYRRLEIGNSQG